MGRTAKDGNRYPTYVDGCRISLCERCGREFEIERLGRAPKKCRLCKLISHEYNPNSRIDASWFPQAFEDSGMSKHQLSKAMGWGRSSTAVNRLLLQKAFRKRTAERLITVLGIDPVDVGL